jgi:hypothetical protein
MADSCERSNESSGSINGVPFLDKLNDLYLLKDDLAARSSKSNALTANMVMCM